MSTGDVVHQWPADRLPARDADVRKARRSLFGPIDHKETEKFVQAALEKQQRLDQEKWDFDFAKEQPLNGRTARYEWEAVPQPEDADQQRAGINGDSASSRTRSRQPQITDFMRKRKHPSGQKSPDGGVKSVRRSST